MLSLAVKKKINNIYQDLYTVHNVLYVVYFGPRTTNFVKEKKNALHFLLFILNNFNGLFLVCSSVSFDCCTYISYRRTASHSTRYSSSYCHTFCNTTFITTTTTTIGTRLQPIAISYQGALFTFHHIVDIFCK